MRTSVYVELKKEIDDERFPFLIKKTNHEALEMLQENMEIEEAEDGTTQNRDNGYDIREAPRNRWEKSLFQNTHKYNNFYLS